MPTLFKTMLDTIRSHELLRAGDRVGIAVSGGADSVALLRLMLEARAELGVVLSVVHFHHHIRGAEADADEAFVASLAHEFGLPFYRGEADTPEYSRRKRLSLEAAARDLRYGYLRELLITNTLDRVATAHTCDDQAETLLLRFLRGAGTRGLAGIYPKVIVKGDAADSPVVAANTARVPSIVRPLLSCRRDELRSYLKTLNQQWREDTSNADVAFTRNRVRSRLIPELERDYNPGLSRVLAETAEVARAEEEFWTAEITRLWPQVLGPGKPSDDPSEVILSIPELMRFPLALQRRMLRAAAEQVGVKLDFHHGEQILAMIRKAVGVKTVELPGDFVGLRVGSELRLRSRPGDSPGGYDRTLAVPGAVAIPEVGVTINAALVPSKVSEDSEGAGRGSLLNPECLASDRSNRDFQVRNWRPGDSYHPAHSKAPRKLKELLQDQRISPSMKHLWPVLVVGEEIVWVPGFELPERLRLRQAGLGILLTFEHG